MTEGHSVPSAFGEGTSRDIVPGGAERLRPPVPRSLRPSLFRLDLRSS